jgi:hypothetical protein
VAVNKKRRKIQLLNLPGGPVPQQQAYPDDEQKMQTDNSPIKDPNAAKWPGKRGGRAAKD